MNKGYPDLPTELRQLIAKKEGLKLETKEILSEDVLNQLSKVCASFANTEGGSMVIGVNKEGKIVGANIEQQVLDRISNEAATCRPPVTVQLNLYQDYGRTVLEVQVPKSAYIHTDKSFRFPLRTGNTTSFMELGTILAYAKERKLIGGELVSTPSVSKRRKPEKNELKLFLEGLSHKDPKVRAYALNNLSSLVFAAEIENDERITRRLVKLIQDPDGNVRQAALTLYEKLNYNFTSTQKAKYNKKIIPFAYKAALGDENVEVRKQALVALVITGDLRAAKAIVAKIRALSDEEYKSAIPDHVWESLTYHGLGPKLRQELFMEYANNKDDAVKRRIAEVTHRHYFG